MSPGPRGIGGGILRETTLPVPPPQEPQELVDWIELTLLSEGRRRLSRTILRARLRDALFLSSAELEETIDFAFQEIDRRRRRAPNGYPFQSGSGGVNRSEGPQIFPYAFLLALSRSPRFRDNRAAQQHAAVLFERLLTVAMRQYLGERARAVRFGWPPRGDRAGNFGEALQWLGKQMGVAPGPGYRPPEQNDGGVDVVAWIPFDDGMPAFLTLLGQGSIGLDWYQKGQDIVEEVWQGWLDFGQRPCRCLGIPFVVPDTEKYWDRLKRSVTVLMDRMRIAEMAAENLGDLAESIEEWTTEEFQEITRDGA